MLTQSSIHNKLPVWYWARNLEAGTTCEIVERNLGKWKFYPLYYSLEVLLLLSGSKSMEILQGFLEDRREMLGKKAETFLELRKNLSDIKSYLGMTKLKRLDHLRRLSKIPNYYPSSLTEEITNKKTKEKSTVFDLIKKDSARLDEYYENGSRTSRYIILDAIGYIRDEQSLDFLLNQVHDEKTYKWYRDKIIMLDQALFCPLLK